ncbi:MAG: DUF4338 domain-containing protein [Candidatus Thiodiazotropha sp. (ex Lucinoma aequizonata)]|nr:DUF4338 domain-containing protein [Candidatus Thiodiazotropha sp. (ex Lucinoma aequizonata)]MCU7888077.1 DUF4338 domain-containing protein [Candidatus Thiodiazotropha sp. (ex Lucinoma aequizonata)]MCU7896828.1 DUF4338 domain-containing protein [Candidatus Thiodiazotropha sp. (ex Lucinoma aequizonata)]MCU7899053.1 DUF4338 domain-containing protein [Candidatus Thiodiazotropha sp. (ex Lucinoma aequizonata)]MCU7903393.1 DUF4338 domain-containing protein [Candidatus Thiodiazotropha sp. (ex Lucino
MFTPPKSALFSTPCRHITNLGASPKIGNALWYIATVEEQWLALLSFSASALKCKCFAGDQWIGWGYRH